MAGALVQWLRDNLGLIDDAAEVEQLARAVDDSGGVVMDDDTRTAGVAAWRRGVERTLGLAAPQPVGAGAA